MTRILGIDPGPTECGTCWLMDGQPAEPAVVSFLDALRMVHDGATIAPCPDVVVIESLECFGMAVGREVFETAYHIGELRGACRDAGITWVLMPRREVKLHLCGTAKARDPNVRRALIELFGGDCAIGTRKSPGPLRGVVSHCWSALALAVTYWHRLEP